MITQEEAAERLLKMSDGVEPEYAMLLVAQAQVHAILALRDEIRVGFLDA